MPNELIVAITKGSRSEFEQVIVQAYQNSQLQSLLQGTNTHLESPLICAIKRQYSSMAQTLIKVGADINYVVPDTKKTPLMYAAERGNDVIVEALIRTGVKLALKDSAEQTAYDIALENGYEEIADMIKNPNKVIEISSFVDSIQKMRLSDPLHPILKEGEALLIAPILPTKQVYNNLSMKQSDIQQFEQLQKEPRGIQQFVNQYIESHEQDGVRSPYIVFGLLLNSAIALQKIDLVKDVIDIINEEQQPNIAKILTFVDGSGYSVISSTLYSGNQTIFSMIEGLVQDLIQKPIIKTDCIEIRHLETVILCPQFEDLDPEVCINEFIRPFYTEESISHITLLLGEL